MSETDALNLIQHSAEAAARRLADERGMTETQRQDFALWLFAFAESTDLEGRHDEADTARALARGLAFGPA